MQEHQELLIDEGSFEKYYPKEKHCDSVIWACPEGITSLLDFDIAAQLNTALLSVYPDIYPDAGISFKDAIHPIQLAYVALEKAVNVLFGGSEIYLFGVSKICSVKTVAATFENVFGSNFFEAPYSGVNGLPSLTPDDLFKISVMECNKLFTYSYNFFHSIEASSKKYFQENYTDYLGKSNFNLDTGLPANKNNYNIMHKENNEQYKFSSKELNVYYQTYISQYPGSPAEEKLDSLSTNT